ncbi:MAG TPA: DUF2721 domain-containing protein [Chloroflexota bacterium]|nr:DUF2721 domain-containing protein [Chloroflexota bacterium]
MTPQAVAQAIQFILAPVVMVTTCALLLNGVLSRYAAINDRLRLMAQERLNLLQSRGSGHSTPNQESDALTAERLRQIDTQVPELLNRHELLRDVLLILYSAITVFIVSVILIAVATVFGIGWAATAALVVFLVGTIGMLIGTVLTSIETSYSHRALGYEIHRIMKLGDDTLRSP